MPKRGSNPLSFAFFTHTLWKTQQPATLNSEPALLPHLKQPNKSQFDKKFTTSPCQTSKIFHGSFENGWWVTCSMAWRWLHENGWTLLHSCCCLKPPWLPWLLLQSSLLCQIDKMTWERGGGRFCIFSIFPKNQIFLILHEATCPCPKFPIFHKNA